MQALTSLHLREQSRPDIHSLAYWLVDYIAAKMGRQDSKQEIYFLVLKIQGFM